MKQRRSERRRSPYFELRAFDAESQDLVGVVQDLSMRGVRLRGDARFREGQRYRLRLEFLSDYGLPGEISLVAVDAVCRWTMAQGDGRCLAGFELTSGMSREAADAIAGVVFRYSLGA